MSIGWRCEALDINSFRGLKSVAIDIPDGAAAVVIGANNAGKSSVLDALSMSLGGPAFYNYTPERFDFFHDANGVCAPSFEINLAFKAGSGTQLPAVRGGIGNPVDVAGVRVTGIQQKNGTLLHETRLLDSNYSKILLPSGVPLKGAAKQQYKGHGLDFSQRYARWSDIAEHRPEVWHLKPGNLFVSLYQWKTGPLQKLAALLAKQFFASRWEFEFADKRHPMPETIGKVHSFFGEAVRNLPFWKDDLRPKLQETLSLYVGRQAQINLKPDIRSVEEWLTQQLVLSFASDSGGATTPLERMGDGWQSLVRIAALDVLSQYPAEVRGQVVLLFEEPESFLHPHLSRKLRGVLEKLAESGWTVLITTHSPNLVSFAGKQHITRLTRKGDDVALHTLKSDEIEGGAKFQERIDERGGHEMLFAKKAVLCEGQDDVFAVRSYLQKRCKIDLDGQSVSIIRVGDVGQLSGFAAMAKKLGIPWCALSDEDRLPDGTIKQFTARARASLKPQESADDMQIYWPVDLENCLGKTQGKATPEWQAENIEPIADVGLSTQYSDYVNTVEKIKIWVEKK